MKKLLLLCLIVTSFYQSFSQINANDWTWIKGANTPNQVASYGTKGVASPTNDPGSRAGAITWELNNKLYLMGGYQPYGFLNDLWMFDLTTNNWTWLSGSNMPNELGNYGTKGVPSATNSPSARINGFSWTYNNKLYLMGGYISTYGSCYNDLWEYDPATNTWTWIKGSNTFNELGIYGTQGVASINNVPGARESSSTWVYNNKFYLFGGYFHDSGIRPKNVLFNDVWEYDPAINNWRWLKGQNNLFEQLGNYGTKGIATSTNFPGSRRNCFTWANNEKAYIFGGEGYYSSGSATNLSDLWEYDAITNNWKWLSGSNLNDVNANIVLGVKGVPAPTNFVGPRQQGGNFFSNNKLFVVGGYTSSNIRDDVWEYDLTTNYWTWLKGSSTGGTSGTYGTQGVSDPDNNPASRILNNGWYINNKYYMFGGAVVGAFLNDLWLYVPTCTEMISVSSGDWNDINTWSCRRIPTVTDDVTINGHSIAVNSNCFAKKVIKKSGAIINVATGGNLKVGN